MASESEFLKAGKEFADPHHEYLEALAQASTKDYREERQRLTSALSKAPSERTEADDNAIAFSRLEGGTAAGCGSCGCR